MSAAQRTATLVLAATLALVGCMAPPKKPPEPPPAPPKVQPPEPEPQREAPSLPPRVGDSERLLYYYEYLLTLDPDQIATEQERTLRFYGEHRSEFALMQLIILRCRPSATKTDRTQALEMLSSYLKETVEQPTEIRPLALLLHNQLLEQQRQDAEIQAQSQKLKEEMRRSEQLQQKLDALVETERKMLERTKPTRTP